MIVTKPYITTDQFMSAGRGFGEVGKNIITVDALSVKRLVPPTCFCLPRTTAKNMNAIVLQTNPKMRPARDQFNELT
jgi:hypothetical protein